jgi:hypothetical protein
MSGTWIDKATIRIGSNPDFKGPSTEQLNYGPYGQPANFQVFNGPNGVLKVYFGATENLDTAKTATYVNNTQGTSSMQQVNLTNTRASVGAPSTTTPTPTPTPAATAADTCKIEGIGWIVCPVASFLGKITDGAYSFVEQFLVFQISSDPFSTDPAINPAYTIWANIRTLANILFIFAFFAIIFSQATSIGLSSYGIKRMLPRLVVAAILVNLSYYLCVLAVDVSNIIGAGLDGLIRSVPLNHLKNADNNTWEKIVSGVLAGVIGGVALAGALYAALGFVLAFLVSSLLALATALLILIGRQALLIMLIIMSPLAFVAYILPNTEDLFNKWRKLFTTLLVMYPLIAMIFAGSKVASEIMRITSPGGLTGAIIQIVSLGVLAIPLFVLPFIIKFSGGVLGRLGGMVNDRNKGVIDRARNKGREFSSNTGYARARAARKQERTTRKSKDFYRAMSGESTGFLANRKRQMGHLGTTGLGTQYATKGGREDIATTRQNFADQYRKIQTEETNRALGSVLEKGGFAQGTKYTVRDRGGSVIGTAGTGNYREMVENALNNAGSTVEIDNGYGPSAHFESKEIAGALMSQTAKMGDVPLTDTLLKSTTAGVSTGMREFISYNPSSYSAKAPDFIKGEAAAFGKPTTEEMMAWHPSTAGRASAYATTDPAAAQQIALTIAQALNNPELRGKLRRENMLTFQGNTDITTHLSAADQTSLNTLITTGK